MFSSARQRPRNMFAPVLESGQNEQGVGMRRNFYPRSVNRIISGRVALSRDALEHILGATAQARST